MNGPAPAGGRRRGARRAPPAAVVAVALVGVAFVALPLAGLVQRVNWSGLGDDLSTPAARRALSLSLTSALWAAGLSVLIGTPLAWVLARTPWKGIGVVRGLVLVPMVLPPVVGGVALLSAFSLRSSLGGWLYDVFGIQLTYSPVGTVMAQTFVALPFYVLTVEGALRSIDQRYEAVAASLGATRMAVFTKVTLPMIAPSVVAGAVLAGARALGEFGATITFAGNIAGRTRTMPLAIYLAMEQNPDTAIALSVVLLAVSLTVLVALRGRWMSPT